MSRYFGGHTIIVCNIFLTEKERLDARWRRIRMNTTGKLASIIMGRCIIIVIFNIILTIVIIILHHHEQVQLCSVKSLISIISLN